MISRLTAVIVSVCIACMMSMQAQKLELELESTTCSGLENCDGVDLGSGSMLRLSCKYDQMLSRSADELGRPVMWLGTVLASYSELSNHGTAATLYPDEIFEASVNVTHIRPLSGRWSVIITAGIGIYTTIDNFSGKDILFNGGAMFSYHKSANLDLGVGVGLTNSYGVPLILPLPYVKWSSMGRYEFNVMMVGRPKVSAAMRVDEQLKLNLDLIEIEGSTAVVRVDGKRKIFSQMSSKTAFRPEYKIGNSVVNVSIGCTWRRDARITNRSMKAFFKSFNHRSRNRFDPAWTVSAGYTYTF